MTKRLGPKPLIFPMPALLVGTYSADGTPNAMTAAWTGVCCHKPLCVGVAIRQNRHTYANLNEKKAFTLAVPKSSQATEVDYLGTVSGSNVPNKLEVAKISSVKADKVDAPIFSDCPVNLECRLIEKVHLGTHDWCIGEVLEVHVDESLVDESGKLDIEGLDPLIYVTSVSEYRSLGKVVGKAYKDGKKLIQG